MLKVGLTGGIGSGKSTIARIFATLGIPVYDADKAARNLINEKEELKKEIIYHFGRESYTGEGLLNRSYISSLVFSDPAKLALLNSLTHPAVIQDAVDWMKQQQSPYAIKEAALLFETGSAAGLDFIIGVYAPKALRIQRTMQRDNITREEVLQRMEKQIEETIKMKLCDQVITNDDQEPVLLQVLQLHAHLLELSRQ